MAFDIDTLETSWSLDISINKFLAGFQIVNDTLIVASVEEIRLIDKRGNQKEIVTDADVKTITKMLAANSKYIYVVGTQNRT